LRNTLQERIVARTEVAPRHGEESAGPSGVIFNVMRFFVEWGRMVANIVVIDKNSGRQVHATGIVRLALHVCANVNETLEDVVEAA
jgi:hypothetical protein